MPTGENTNVVEDSLQKATSLYGIPLKVITWNVNGKIDTLEEIRDKLMYPSYYEMPTEDPRLVIVGLQEMVELSAANVIENSVAITSSSSSNDRFLAWKDVILEVLQERNPNFCFIGGDSLVGMALMVFSDASLNTAIRNIQVQKLPRGVGGVLGNKGAVYFRMDLMDSSLCFISAHFAAHRDKVKKRNEDYHAILTTPVFTDSEELASVAPQWTISEQQRVNKLKYDIERVKRRLNNVVQNYGHNSRSNSSHSHSHSQHHLQTVGSTSASSGDMHTIPMVNNTSSTSVGASYTRDRANSGHEKLFHKELNYPFSANDHDVIIFVGDLNYRIVSSVDIMDVYEMIHGHELLRLASYDQLCQEREKNTVFSGFNEGLLTFPPTYQFIPGKNVYDDRKDKKMRCPAWCDRILWRCGRPQRQMNTNLSASKAHKNKRLNIVTNPVRRLRSDIMNDGDDDNDGHHSLDEGGDDQEDDNTDYDNLTISQRSIETTRVEVGSPFPIDTPMSVYHPQATPKPPATEARETRNTENDPDNIYGEEEDAAATSTKYRVFFPDDPDRPPDSDDDSDMGDVNGIISEQVKIESPLRKENEASSINSLDAIIPTGLSASSTASSDQSPPRHPHTNDTAQNRLSRPLPTIPSFPTTIPESSSNKSTVIDEDEIEEDTNNKDSNDSDIDSEAMQTVQQKQRSEEIARRLLARNSMRLSDNAEIKEYVRRSSMRLSGLDMADLTSALSANLETGSEQAVQVTAESNNVESARKGDDIEHRTDEWLSSSQKQPQSQDQSFPSPPPTSKARNIEEAIELISYHSCTNLISDHKPVTALMWLKVRRIDWSRHENRLINCYAPLLNQANVQPLHTPALDLSWHRTRLLTNPPPLFVADINQNLQKQVFPSAYFRASVVPATSLQSQSQFHNTHQNRPHHLESHHHHSGSDLATNAAPFQPTCILLRSMNKDGAHAVLEVTNRSPSLPALLHIAEDSVPSWLAVQVTSSVLLPQHSVQITVTNDHTLSTLQLVQDVDQYRDYAQENLKTIGKFIDVPPNDPAMQINACLRATLTWSLDAMTVYARKQQAQQQQQVPGVPTSQQIEAAYMTKLFEGAARGELARQKRRSFVLEDEAEEVTVVENDDMMENHNLDSSDVDDNQENNDLDETQERKVINVLPTKDCVVRSFVIPIVCSLAMDQSL